MKQIIVSTTMDNKKDAETLAKKIIKTRLGKCIQISSIKSIYEWKDKIEKSNEFKLEIKTSSYKYKKLENFILKNHKYELPEIIITKIKGGYSKYLEWLKK